MRIMASSSAIVAKAVLLIFQIPPSLPTASATGIPIVKSLKSVRYDATSQLRSRHTFAKSREDSRNPRLDGRLDGFLALGKSAKTQDRRTCWGYISVGLVPPFDICVVQATQSCRRGLTVRPCLHGEKTFPGIDENRGLCLRQPA